MPKNMKPQDFVVAGRPRLAAITEHPAMEFADYERRLTSLQGVLQLIQQAYLSTQDRALIVLEGWDTAGKGGIVWRLGWALDPRSFKVHSIAAPDEHEREQHYLQRFWHRLRQRGRSLSSTGRGMGACWSNASKDLPPNGNGAGPIARSANSNSCWLRQVCGS